MKKFRKTFLSFEAASDAEFKALGDKPDGYVAGWASTSSTDTSNHVVEPGAFNASIKERGLKGPRSIKLLMGHDRNKIAGSITVLEQKGNRLWIEAQLNLNISYVKDLYEAIKSSGGLSFSVGFYLGEHVRNAQTGVLTIKSGDLFEISVVPFPANEEAIMAHYKSDPTMSDFDDDDDGDDVDGLFQPKTVAEFEKAVVAMGMVPSRRSAKLLSSFVKQHAELFSKTPEAPEVPEDKTSIDPSVLTELEQAFAKMRQSLGAVTATA